MDFGDPSRRKAQLALLQNQAAKHLPLAVAQFLARGRRGL